MLTQSVVYFKSRKTESEREYRVKDVVRSTSAAPTYFPPAFISDLNDGHQMINLDGGVFANNPAMCAYVAARETDFGKIKNPAAKDMVFLSLGTGGGRIKFPEEKKSEKWGVISWAKAAPDIMMDGAAETINYQLKAIFGTLGEENGKQYKRVDVPFDKRTYSYDMSDASDDNITALKEAGEKTLEDARKKKEDELTLDEFIQLLIE